MCSVTSSSARIRTTAFTSFLYALLLALAPVSSFAAGSIQLAWDPSIDSGVVGYFVYYGPSSGNYTNAVFVGNVTNATVTGLVPGGTYFFAATTTNNIGLESLFSNEATTTLGTPNVAPTMNVIANLALNESAAAQSVSLSGITSGATNEVQTLVVTASSGNTALIPNPTVTYTSPNTTGSLAFTPVANAYGSAVITVTVNDGGSTNNTITRTFTVTVAPVNQQPTLFSLGDLNLAENAGLQSIGLAGIGSGAANESQTLTVTASSSNTGLIPNPSVSYTSPNTTGSISFTPVANASGVAVITVTVNDGGASNNIISRTFNVAVATVNQAPTLAAISNVTVNQSGGLQTVNLSGISSGAANESQTLTVTASSSNTGAIPNPSVSYTSPNATGSISFTPVANATGSSTITVTVNDGGASNNVVSRTFTVTINQQPTITALTNLVIAVDRTTPALPFSIADAETAAGSLVVSASSSNTAVVANAGLVLAGNGANRTLQVTPLAGQTGITTITVSVSDGSATATRSFQLSVQQRPAAPGSVHVVAQN